LLNSALTFLGLANIALTFSRVCWSLIGAQGRFRTATMVMLLSRWLVALPVAFVCIFGLFLDLNAVVAAVAVGYATACCALACILFRSDWERLTQDIQDLNIALGVLDDFDESYDDSENSADRPASGNL
jgi:Na+-driven multidrug efflux pump